MDDDVYLRDVSMASPDRWLSTIEYGYRGDNVIFAVFLLKSPSGQYNKTYKVDISSTYVAGTNVCARGVIKFPDESHINLKTEGGMFEFIDGSPMIMEKKVPCSRTQMEIYIRAEHDKFIPQNLRRSLAAESSK